MSVVKQEFLNYNKENNNNYKDSFEKIVAEHQELTKDNLLDVVEGYDVGYTKQIV